MKFFRLDVFSYICLSNYLLDYNIKLCIKILSRIYFFKRAKVIYYIDKGHKRLLYKMYSRILERLIQQKTFQKHRKTKRSPKEKI